MGASGGPAGGVVHQPEVEARRLRSPCQQLEVDLDAVRELIMERVAVGVVPDAPLVAADVEGGGPDAPAGAEALVKAVVSDLERVRAHRLLHGARRRRTRRQSHRALGRRRCCHGCATSATNDCGGE